MDEQPQVTAEDLEQDSMKARRKKLIFASKTPRKKDEIEAVLKPYRAKGISWIVDDKECTITREFFAMIQDPSNNKLQRQKEVTLTVSGNLRRPIEDFEYDVKWLLAQVGSIQDAQKGQMRRGA